jgi:hypothetical protein
VAREKEKLTTESQRAQRKQRKEPKWKNAEWIESYFELSLSILFFLGVYL